MRSSSSSRRNTAGGRWAGDWRPTDKHFNAQTTRPLRRGSPAEHARRACPPTPCSSRASVWPCCCRPPPSPMPQARTHLHAAVQHRQSRHRTALLELYERLERPQLRLAAVQLRPRARGRPAGRRPGAAAAAARARRLGDGAVDHERPQCGEAAPVGGQRVGQLHACCWQGAMSTRGGVRGCRARKGTAAGAWPLPPPTRTSSGARTMETNVPDGAVQPLHAGQHRRVKGVVSAAVHDNVRVVGCDARPAGSAQSRRLGAPSAL